MKIPYMKNVLLLVCIIILPIISATPVFSARWYVNPDSTAADGKTWDTGFHEIQEAIDEASSMWNICMGPEDEIWVKQGCYALSDEITLYKAVALYGGFKGEESSLEERDWEVNSTMIYGGGSVRCISVTSFCIIDGFTLFKGSSDKGGGMYINSPPVYCDFLDTYFSPVIRNCFFSQNSGSGLYSFNSNPRITNCKFIGNSGPAGGAIFHIASSPRIEKCFFRMNEALEGYTRSRGGGAICGVLHQHIKTDERVTIKNCLFHDNDSASYGGALSYYLADPLILQCTFADNSAAYGGGGVSADGGDSIHNPYTFQMNNSILWNNSPDQAVVFNFETPRSVDVSYCDIEGGWTGPGSHNIVSNPEFGFTTAYDLRPGSPCIDTGDSIPDIVDDITGTTRPLDGDGDGTAAYDMGACEYEP